MKKAALSILLLLFFINIHATHLVGGTITYKYVGSLNNGDIVRYQLIIKMYRDISLSTNVTFDPDIDIGIYNDKKLYNTKTISLSTETTLSNCYTEGTYSANIDLNAGKEYVFIYARCCLSQFQNVEYDQGFSLYSYMQNSSNNNSSPILNNVLVNYVLSKNGTQNFDLKAIDIDSDYLQFKIVAALLGGDKSAPKPVVPNTIDNTFPPYSNNYGTIIYNTGYTSIAPFGTFGGLTIDSNTGKATISSPKACNSRFLWCIKISEYKNNMLTGITYLPICSQFDVVNSNCVHNIGLKEASTNEPIVSPNPFTNDITIANLPKSISKIGVYDITGKQLDLIPIFNSNQVTYSSNNPNGMYLLRFMDGNGNVVGTHKIVKR